MIDNGNGRKWARFSLAFALLLSVGGNIGHTVMADSVIPVWLRMIGAVAWPFLTFLGIEVLVRVYWERSFTHRLARNMVLIPAAPAAIVSFEHLYSFLGIMGERPLIQWIGPFAVDGAMIGFTIVLLVTRAMPASAPAEHTNVDAEIERLTALHEEHTAAGKRSVFSDVIAAQAMRGDATPIVIDPKRGDASIGWTQEFAQPKSRAPRAGSAEREAKVRAMLEDPELKTDPKDSTMRRYAKVAREMRANPTMDVDYKGVRSEVVETIIRPWANLERVR